MNSYVIKIDDELYESADNYDVAKHLYNTVDATCLLEYNGHRKSLMARIDGHDYQLKGGINAILKEHGGDLLEGWFGSSSEYFRFYEWIVNFGSGYCTTTPYKNNSGLARAVAALQ